MSSAGACDLREVEEEVLSFRAEDEETGSDDEEEEEDEGDIVLELETLKFVVVDRMDDGPNWMV